MTNGKPKLPDDVILRIEVVDTGRRAESGSSITVNYNVTMNGNDNRKASEVAQAHIVAASVLKQILSDHGIDVDEAATFISEITPESEG